jgi:23S rRNA pseudouridine2605 synthase
MPKARPLLRLQKIMADCGIASRRKCEEIILEGRVTVNDEVVTALGTKVDPVEDTIAVDGEMIDRAAIDKTYIVLHKPRGYVTTVHDPEGRKTVLDLCRGIKTRIFPVGRLDYLSEGLLLLTNDGDFANIIMHPRYEVTKVYEVKVFGIISESILQKLRQGVRFEDGLLKPRSVRIIKQLPRKTWIEFRLNEGKNREIRRLCEAVGLTIDKLKRVAIENLSIDGIKPGDFHLYTKRELLRLLGLDEKGKKVKKDIKYTSGKKSQKVNVKINDKKRRRFNVLDADSPEFARFRKKNYYETIQIKKEVERKKREQAEDQLS